MLIIYEFCLAMVSAGAIFILYRILKDRLVSSILSVSLIVCFILWYALPILLRLSGVEGSILYYSVDDELFAKYALMEISGFTVTIGLFSIGRTTLKALHSAKVLDIALNNQQTTAAIIFGLLLFVAVNFHSYNYTYDELNSINIMRENSTISQWSGTIAVIFSICYSLVIAVLVEPKAAKRNASYLWLLSLIFLCIVLAYNISNGSRINLIMLFILISIYYHSRYAMSPRVLVVSITLFFAAIFIGGIIGNVVGILRSQGKFTILDIAKFDGDIYEHDVARSFLTKFDSISPGAILVQYSGYGEAGLMPYEGVVLSIIPRFILPSKPTPGSIDGSSSGEPARLVPILMGIHSDSLNVGVSPVSITIWQLGTIGLGAFILLNWLNLVLINTVLSMRSLLTKAIGISMIGLPAIAILIAAPNQLLMNQIRVAAIFLSINFVRRVFPNRARSTQNFPMS